MNLSKTNGNSEREGKLVVLQSMGSKAQLKVGEKQQQIYHNIYNVIQTNSLLDVELWTNTFESLQS